jgi:tight adherence protein B
MAVAAFLAGLGAWFAPHVLFGDRTTAQRVARIEAVAVWTEMLRDTLASAAGLEQAIAATATAAPAPIRDQVQALAARIDRGERLAVALRRLADDLDDPTADLVVAALVLAAQHQARNLTDLLASLAHAARDQATMRLRVSAGRARVRTTVRIIVAVTLTMAAGLTLLNRPYLAAYGSPGGQLVLAAIGGVFALALAWLMRIARISDPPRVLTGLHAIGAGERNRARTPGGAAP